MARKDYIQGILLSFILFCVGCVDCENFKTGTNYTFKPAIPGAVELGDWKLNGNLVVVWEGKSNPVWYRLKDRAQLNTDNGDFTVRLKKEDRGVFKAQFLVKGVLKHFERTIKVIDPVTKPKVTCEQNDQDITLKCSVEAPVQALFTWSGPDGFSHVGDSVQITRKPNDDSIYYCSAKNEVSVMSAEFKLKDCISEGCVDCENFKTGTNYTFKPAIPGAIELGYWRLNGNLVVVWEGKSNPVWYRLKDRAQLNTDNGDLTVRLKKEDSGVFKARFQGQGFLKDFERTIKVIDTVTKPKVSCEQNDQDITLKCAVEAPVQALFTWSGPDGFSHVGDSVQITRKQNDDSIYYCSAKNGESVMSAEFKLKDCISEGCVDCENFKTGTNYTFKPAIPGVIELGDWKLNGNLVVVWEGKSEPVWYRIKDRAQLNTDNGDLTVRLKKEDSGVFKAQFQVQGVLKYFERTIKVIDPVTKPKVTCEQNDQDITLKCAVEAPVQALFTWSGPDGFSHVGDSVQITRKQNDNSIYYCSAKNEVSVMSAEFKLKDCISEDCKHVATGTVYTFTSGITGDIELGDWRLNGNLVVEWEGKSEPVWYRLQDRAKLNRANGDLSVVLQKNDSGEYKALFQVKGVLQYYVITINVIDPVTKPKVTCEQNDQGITLKCSLVPPVEAKFKWTGPNGFSHVGDSVQITRKPNDDSIYYCSAKNEVSVMSAEFKLKDCISEGCVDCENFKTGTIYTFKPAIPGAIELGDWRLNGNLLVEWEGKSEPVWYRLKDRAQLNTDNGDLTVRLKKEDSGVFMAQFQVQGVVKYFERTVKVIDTVTKPKVTCEQNDQDITLKCSVEAPVQALFTWSGPDGFSHVGDSVQITRKQNDDSIYYCSAQNEVSVMSAEFKLKDCISEGCVDCENFKIGTIYTFKPAIPGAIELGDWRLNGNLLVEWEGKSEPVWYRLKDRAQLNTDNGDLTVRLKKEDSGVFKAHFLVQGVMKYFERTVKVIDTVTKPKVTCEQNDQDITLKCSVEAPVQALFTWSGPDGFSHVGDSVQITRKQNDDSIYYCSAKNEVSVMSAEFKLKDCISEGCVDCENFKIGTIYTFKPAIPGAIELGDWRLNGNLLVEWEGKSEPVWYRLKDRAQLNTDNGDLTVRLKKEDSGVFKAHFLVQGVMKYFERTVKVIDPVTAKSDF
ncbi:uncharacterized protein LOC113654382 isoform X4 [Tachysurus fulvidraco]|uniref:uncharacterized protein LOC113654382 isoform X4 n=1 Tax=Tachysurus fulvidraco TaxID=1234273 RepID=UPI001FEE3DA9|nr:uncharacterized protein LOC113654382 isoform X4 [Tachysurus fulvidraco]